VTVSVCDRAAMLAKSSMLMDQPQQICGTHAVLMAGTDSEEIASCE